LLPINNQGLVFLAAMKPFVSSQSKNLIETLMKLCQDQRHTTMTRQEKRGAMRGLLTNELTTIISLVIILFLVNRETTINIAPPVTENNSTPVALPAPNSK